VNQFYIDAARLLIQVAPAIFESGLFALKGGTAINLFVGDMPRLSVDLDLVFPNYSLPRDQALARINEAIRKAAQRLKTRGFQVRTVTATGAGETKLLVRRGNLEIKVEVNFVLRGTVHPVLALPPRRCETSVPVLSSSFAPIMYASSVMGSASDLVPRPRSVSLCADDIRLWRTTRPTMPFNAVHTTTMIAARLATSGPRGDVNSRRPVA
jgi:hypothetical protein